MSMRKLISLILACLMVMTTIMPLAVAESLETPTDIYEEVQDEFPDEEEPEAEEPTEVQPEDEDEVVEDEPVEEEPAEEEPADEETEEDTENVESEDEESEEAEEDAAEASDFEVENGVLIAYNGSDATVEIPEDVTVIGYRAFADNEDLRVVILNNVEEIRAEAFIGCSNLVEVRFDADKLMKIGSSAFENCELLKPLAVSADAVVAESAYYGCDVPEVEEPEEEETEVADGEVIEEESEDANAETSEDEKVEDADAETSEDADTETSEDEKTEDADAETSEGEKSEDADAEMSEGEKSEDADAETSEGEKSEDADTETSEDEKAEDADAETGKDEKSEDADADNNEEAKAETTEDVPEVGRTDASLLITKQPEDAEVKLNENAVFTIDVVGEGLSYQWKYSKNGGTSWSNATATGAKTATMTVPGTTTRNGYLYRCEVTDSSDKKVTSVSVMLTVYAFTITKQPESVNAELNENVVFEVAANGEELSYVWQYSKNGTSWANATATGSKTATMTVPATLTRNGYLYRCVITDKEGTKLTSNAAKLTVDTETDSLKIVTQPTDIEAVVDSNAVFTIEAKGTGLVYQWQYSKNGTTWASATATGAKTAIMTVPATTTRNNNLYRCVVTDATGEKLTSNVVRLTVVESSSDTLSIVTQPVDASAELNDTVHFSVVAEGAGLTYLWQYSKDAVTWASTTLSGYKTNTLNVPVTTLRNGYYYHCIVTDKNGETVTSNPAKLTIATSSSLKIVTQPEDATAPLNGSVNFTVEAEGEELTYLWQYSKNNSTWGATTLTGYKTDTLTVPATSTRNGYYYHCIVTDKYGNKVTSNGAQLIVGEPTELKIVKQPEDAEAMLNETATFTVEAEGDGLTYLWQYSKDNVTWGATALGGYKTATLSVPATTTRNGYYYHCIVTDQSGNKVTSEGAKLSLKPTNELEITQQPADVSADADDSVQFTVEAKGDGLTYLWKYSKNDGATWLSTTTTGYKTETLTVPATLDRNGYLYRCTVSDQYGNKVNSDPAKLTVIDFVITKQPENASAAEDDVVAFAVEATGNGLTYQWQYKTASGSTWNNATDDGSTTSELTVTAAMSKNGNQYRCVVSNALGKQLTSDAATLVIDTFVINDVVYKVIADGNATVVAYTGSASAVIIPSSINGYTVTEIGDSAFEGNKTLCSIDLPDTIVRIGKRAFANCINLSEMN